MMSGIKLREDDFGLITEILVYLIMSFVILNLSIKYVTERKKNYFVLSSYFYVNHKNL